MISLQKVSSGNENKKFVLNDSDKLWYSDFMSAFILYMYLFRSLGKGTGRPCGPCKKKENIKYK